MERLRRLVLWVVMFLLTFVLFLKGHGPLKEGGSVAFLHEDAPCITIRIDGNVVNTGIYTFQCNTDIETVIKMTVPDLRPERVYDKLLNRVLQSGDVLELIQDNSQHVDITIKKMPAREMVVLGIPLDPNRLGVDDWEGLPGIGAALANRIVKYRQENGDFRSFSELERVPGIGEAKIGQLAKYF